MNDIVAEEQAAKATANFAGLGVPAMIWNTAVAAGPAKLGVFLGAEDAQLIAELADYAYRRGYKLDQARREIASRTPHKFNADTSAAGLTCTECGRSEIFSNHVKESK